MDTVVRNLRMAFRAMRRHPGHAITSVAVLALGIGATAAIFTALNSFFFRPLPFVDEDRLVAFVETNPEFEWTHAEAAPANMLDWRERVDAFEDVAGYSEFASRGTWIREGEPILVDYTQVTGNLFDVLGVRPALGRPFTWEETWSESAPVVLISHSFWQSRFGGDASVVDRMIEVSGLSVQIVGVMPRGVEFPFEGIDMWLPYRWDPAAVTEVWFRRAHFVRAVARLRSDVSPESADASLQAVVASLQQEYPETNRVMGAGMIGLRSFLIREVRTPLLILQGAVALLLLLACVNVVNLTLLRSTERVRDVSLRRALGAEGRQVAWQLLTENLALSAVGGGIGLAGAVLAIRALESLTPLGISGVTAVAMDGRVLALVFACTTLCGVVAAMAPMVTSRRIDISAVLRSGDRRAGGGIGGLARGLVAAEVALALVLVAGAGLMVRTAFALRGVDPGFQIEGVAAIEFAVPAARYPDRNSVLDFTDEFVARLEGNPRIRSAGTVAWLPLSGSSWSSQFQAEGWSPDRVGLDIVHRRADAGYFETLEIPLIRGRLFDPAVDGRGAPGTVVINETFARMFFPNEDPVGQRIAYDRLATAESNWYEIIGIVGDQHQVSPSTPVRPEAFENRDYDWDRRQWIVLSTEGDTGEAIALAESILTEMDGQIPVSSRQTLHDVWKTSMRRQDLVLNLLLAFGVVALVLASIGVYGVTAQMAGQRRREMGIRLALGAERAGLLRLVVGQGMAAVAVGLAAGVGGVLLMSRALNSYLFAVAPTDPATIATVGIILAGAGLTACLIPALRATRVDPSSSLRSEG